MHVVIPICSLSVDVGLIVHRLSVHVYSVGWNTGKVKVKSAMLHGIPVAY